MASLPPSIAVRPLPHSCPARISQILRDLHCTLSAGMSQFWAFGFGVSAAPKRTRLPPFDRESQSPPTALFRIGISPLLGSVTPLSVATSKLRTFAVIYTAHTYQTSCNVSADATIWGNPLWSPDSFLRRWRSFCGFRRDDATAMRLDGANRRFGRHWPK